MPQRYLENVWYCAAIATEVAQFPLARTICERPIVFFRDARGEIAALDDRCSHRQAPLSLARIVDGRLECSYHGFTFDGSGRCVHIPQQSSIPRAADIRAYPVHERDGHVWLWLGERPNADPTLIPSMPWIEDAAQRCVFFRFAVNANFQLMADNLMDVSHTDFLHRASIGSQTGRIENDETEIEMDCNVDGDRVRFTRRVKNTLLGPVSTKWAGSTKRVTRTNYLVWEAPNTIHSVLEFQNEETHHTIHLDHIMTPETATTMHYFMPWTRDFGLDNVMYPTDQDVRDEQTMVVGGDDIPMVEAQQRNLAHLHGIRDVPSRQDRFVVTVHRRLAALYEENDCSIPVELQRLGLGSAALESSEMVSLRE